jgi:hypothetical protein
VYSVHTSSLSSSICKIFLYSMKGISLLPKGSHGSTAIPAEPLNVLDAVVDEDAVLLYLHVISILFMSTYIIRVNNNLDIHKLMRMLSFCTCTL